MSDQLHINLLGPMHVRVGDKTAVFRTDALRILLAYLAAHQGIPQRRDTLAGLLSPDRPDKEALTYLRNRLTRLRAAVEDDKAIPPWFDIDRKQIALRTGDDISIDLIQFEQQLKAVETHPHRQLAGCPTCLARLEEATRLVRGELLAGLNFPSDTWESWLMTQREHFQQRAIESMGWLREARITLGEWTAVLDIAQRQLTIEPWLESAHRAIMLAYGQLGDRNAALAQFEQCKTLLWEELGVEPEEETIEMMERLSNLGLAAEDKGQNSAFDLLPSSFPNNLPLQTTRFFGREAEQTQLLERLVDPNYRLITLAGTGGIGKTRLAIEVGQQVKMSFPDGIWFVPLDAIRRDAEQIKIAIGEAARLGQMGKQLTGEQVLAILRDKRMLLILDNCETVLDELDFIPEWLRRMPQIAILATSREPLNFQSESIVSINGLPIGDGDNQVAEALFAERGQMARFDFEVTTKNMPQVRQICELVDGSPLGIGLAAASVSRRSLTQIIAEIDRSLDILSTRWRDVDPRHRSVRAVFETSWQLLELAERDGLAALSVFPTSFTAVAAAEISGATQLELDLLSEKSLLQQEHGSERFIMHSLVRQFAAEKLGGRYTAVDSAFVDYYHQYASNHQDDYAQLQPEWRNFSTAVSKAHALEAWHSVLNLVQLLDEPWFRQIRFSDMREALTLAVNAAKAVADLPALAKILIRLGEIGIELSEYDAAEVHLADALLLTLRLKDNLSIAQTKYLIGRVKMEQSHDDEARTLFMDSKRLFERENDGIGVARNLNYIAISFDKQNPFDQTVQTYLEHSITLQKKLPPSSTYVEALRLMSRNKNRFGEFDEAKEYLAEAKSISLEQQDIGEYAAVLYEFMIMHKRKHEFDQALQIGFECLDYFFQLGSLRWQALVKVQLGLLYKAKTQPHLTIPLILDGLQIFIELGDLFEQAHSQYILYELYAEIEDVEQSKIAKQHAKRLAQTLQITHLQKRLA